jgi:hypothetical protein
MNKTTTTERFALIAIAIGLLISGWMDGNDAKLAEKYRMAESGKHLACIQCGER